MKKKLEDFYDSSIVSSEPDDVSIDESINADNSESADDFSMQFMQSKYCTVKRFIILLVALNFVRTLLIFFSDAINTNIR